MVPHCTSFSWLFCLSTLSQYTGDGWGVANVFHFIITVVIIFEQFWVMQSNHTTAFEQSCQSQFWYRQKQHTLNFILTVQISDTHRCCTHEVHPEVILCGWQGVQIQWLTSPRNWTNYEQPVAHIRTIGQFSETGLHEWMPFIIFHTISHERLQLPLLGWFLSRRWFMLCIIVEAEPRTAKLYKCYYRCVCKNYKGKVMEDGKKVSLHHFSAGQKIVSAWRKKMLFGASYSMSKKFFLVARHADFRPSKIPLKLAL